MNENIDLTKILKNCPKGMKLYTTVWGEVTFDKINNKRPDYPINVKPDIGYINLTKEGCYTNKTDAECILFPSKEQRDWSKFIAPWYKKERFDPSTLRPFDRVLAKDFDGITYWTCNFFSHYNKDKDLCYCVGDPFCVCIPYNDETKHLVGTKEEAPEYYRYWEE